ncbi:MAG: hypothetical protein QOH79_3159 [Acidimicrobiaceae bacterium]
MKLERLRPRDVQRFVAQLIDTLGAGTTHSVYAVLRSALRAAVDNELLARSPTRGIKLPSIQKTSVRVLHPDELQQLAAATPELWRPMIFVAGVCGLRFAEIAGLRVGRLDLLRRQLHVVETSPQVGPDRAEPKTAAGRRSVPMPMFVAAQLSAHLAARGLDASDDDALVFAAAKGGRLYAGNWHGDVWTPARWVAGFPTLRFHEPSTFGRTAMGRHGSQPAAGQPLARPQLRADHRGCLRPSLQRDERCGHGEARRDLSGTRQTYWCALIGRKKRRVVMTESRVLIMWCYRHVIETRRRENITSGQPH